jgi:CPA1 family monovalent cation:H+ antiporter
MVFLLDAAVFVLIGLSLRDVMDRVGAIDVVIERFALPVAAVLVGMTFARFAWIFGSDALLRLSKRAGWRFAEPLGTRAATVVSWAGMRGVVTLAVALSVPAAVPGRDLMLVTAFAVIAVTVLVQATTLGWLIRWAGLREAVRAKPPLDLFAPKSFGA